VWGGRSRGGPGWSRRARGPGSPSSRWRGRLANASAAAAYEALPLPDPSEEAWRFTDLAGFDPAAFGHVPVPGTVTDVPQLVELDVAGLATVTEDGIEIERAPDGITFAPLDEAHPRLYELVGWSEEFAPHNAAVWQHRLFV